MHGKLWIRCGSAVNEWSLGNTKRLPQGRSRDCYAWKEVLREQMSGPHGGTHTLLTRRICDGHCGGSLTRYLGNLYRTLWAPQDGFKLASELRRSVTAHRRGKQKNLRLIDSLGMVPFFR